MASLSIKVSNTFQSEDNRRGIDNMIKVSHLLLLISALLSQLDSAQGKGNSAPNIIPLEKLTVGPYDNYQGQLSESTDSLYFTQSQNLSPQIHAQPLDSEFPKAITSSRADAKDPTPSKDGKLLAFTYFKFDSKGDICLKSLPNGSIKCVSTNKTADHSPFWINDRKLGFLTSQNPATPPHIKIVNLDDKLRRRIVLRGVSSPAAHPNGVSLVYIGLGANGRKAQINLLSLKDGAKPSSITLDLPGIPSFPKYSPDGRYLYFSHYLNDTNLDQKIDGNDNSVIFRINAKKLESGSSKIFPEQLTSVENNCSFPSPQRDFLLVTCSFEGSLDLYRLPLTGALPKTWGIKQLWEAHATSRSYQDRLLILNKIRFLSPKHNRLDLVQRVLSNHIAISEYEAATYNINQLIKESKKGSLKASYRVLQIYLDVKQARSQESTNLLSRGFKKFAKGKLSKLSRIIVNRPIKKIIEAHVFHLLNDNRMAAERLKVSGFSSSKKLSPMERYLAFDLYERLYSRKSKQSKLLPLYKVMMSDSQLSDESKIHYTFRYLSKLAELYGTNKRLKALERDTKSTKYSQKILDLIELERLSLQLGISQDKKNSKALFSKLDKAMNKSRKQYFLRRASYIRAILILSQYDKLDYMSKVASNWLRYTNLRDLEFHYASAQYTYATMDKAYGEFANSKDRKAFNIFYRAIRQTDDLEAHSGYFDLGFKKFAAKYSESLASLEERDIIGDSRDYNKALRHTLHGEEKRDIESFNKAISELEGIKGYIYNPAMKYLLLAYNYQMKLQFLDKKKVLKSEDFKKAHKFYMIALYEGKDNIRVKASILSNLSFLHQSAGNHSIATNFFKKRSQLPFVNSEAQLAFYWQYSRSLFYASDYSEAAIQSEQALKLIKKQKLRHYQAPFTERSAFYAMNAREFKKAKKHYQKLFRSYDNKLKPKQKAKAKLAFGFTLMNLKEKKRAVSAFKDSINITRTLKPEAASKGKTLAFHPSRLRILAYGFLAKLSPSEDGKINYRLSRIQEFRTIMDKDQSLGHTKGVIQVSIIKDHNIVADTYIKMNKTIEGQKALESAIMEAKDWSENAGDPYSIPAFRSLVNYMSFAVANSSQAPKDVHEGLESMFKNAKTSYEELKSPAPMQTYQFLKLKILWTAFQVKQGTAGEQGSFKAEMAQVFKKATVTDLKSKMKPRYSELISLKNGLSNAL